MGYKIIISPNAINSVGESIEWYNAAQLGLGLRFYKQIQSALKRIQKNPTSFAVRYKNIRTVVVKQFPFLIHYSIDTDNKTIVINAVLHTSRDPQKWEGNV